MQSFILSTIQPKQPHSTPETSHISAMYLQTSSGDILRDSPESGTYIIRSGSSTLSLNIICRSPGEKPLICLWDAVRSTTQRWCIECRGADYVIWNATTGHFLSFDVETGLSRTSTMTELSDDSSIAPSAVVQLPIVDAGGTSSKKLKITGSQHPILWSIKRVGSSFHIKLASDQELALDADGFCEKNGSQLVACNDFHELESQVQQWKLERLDDAQISPCSRRFYIGPIPPGVYSFQVLEGTVKMENRKPTKHRSLRLPLALGVTARTAFESVESGHISLCPIGRGPWPHHIWALESGIHGFRIKNLGINAYLVYVDSELRLESGEDSLYSATEWVPQLDSSRASSHDYFSASLRPSCDLNMMLGVSKNDLYHTLCIRSLGEWEEEIEYGIIFHQWRFDAVHEEFLNLLDHLE